MGLWLFLWPLCTSAHIQHWQVLPRCCSAFSAQRVYYLSFIASPPHVAEFKLCDIPGLKQQHLPGAHLPSEDGAAPWKLMAHQGYACAHHRIKSRFEMPADGMEMVAHWSGGAEAQWSQGCWDFPFSLIRVCTWLMLAAPRQLPWQFYLFISNILLKPYWFSSRSLFLVHLELEVTSETWTCKDIQAWKGGRLRAARPFPSYSI